MPPTAFAAQSSVPPEKVRLSLPRGRELVATHHAGAGRGVVVCGHAMMCNARTFERGAAARLRAAGFDVYTVDLPGHGHSRAPGEPSGGHWSYDELVLDLWPAAVAAARARHPGLPAAVVGHSLCAHGTLAWLGQSPGGGRGLVEAVVNVAGNIWLRRYEASTARWLRKRATIAAWGLFTQLVGRFPARRLRLGTEDVPREFVADFQRWVGTGAWTTASGRDYRAGLATITVPVLSVLGAADTLLCAPDSGRAFAAELIAAPRSEVWLVGHHDHPGLVPDHMRLVAEPSAAPLWSRIATWLEKTLASPHS